MSKQQPTASQTVTVAGNTTSLDLAGNLEGQDLYAQIVVTAASGTTPALGAVLQQSLDGSTWTTTDSFPAINAAGTFNVRGICRGMFARIAWTPTGTTPSFTFSASLWA